MKDEIKASLVSVILRAHDPDRGWILRNALQSIADQSYEKIEVVLVIQNYEPEQLSSLEGQLKKVLSPRKIGFQIELLTNADSKDLRSHALNRGLVLSRGNRICFLDYDDVYYPDAVERLSEAMDSSGAGCVVGAADFAFVEYDFSRQQLDIVRKERFFADRPSVERLSHNSFIPIHSFMVDKNKAGGLKFLEDMCLFEDYAYLLELSKRTQFDFSLFNEKAICEYRVEQRGGASILGLASRNPSLYKSQRAKVWDLRRKLGFLTAGYFLKHPFYFPLKTKLGRLFKKL